MSFPDPSVKWKTGVCNMVIRMQISNKTANNKVNPLKTSKKVPPGGCPGIEIFEFALLYIAFNGI